MRIHKEERKYLCPDCGYKCKWVNQLKYHMTKHTGECCLLRTSCRAPGRVLGLLHASFSARGPAGDGGGHWGAAHYVLMGWGRCSHVGGKFGWHRPQALFGALEMGILVCLLTKWDAGGSPWGLMLCYRDGGTRGLESSVPPLWCHPLPVPAGLKPYRCDECEYCTNRADALRVHKETRHQEARSFICEQCGKAFKTRFLLKTHLKKHSEEKPYVCNTCGRAFRWAAGLRHHYLTHTNEHPFFCRYCPYKAKQKFQVIKHIQRHHPEHGAVDPSQGVGKDPSTHTVHLHTVQRESQAKGPARMEQEGGCPVEEDGTPQ